jgi:hypothetical protein
MRLVVCLTMYLMPILANAAQTKDRRRSKTAAARGCQGVAQHGRPRHLALRRAVLPERRTGAALGDRQLLPDMLDAGAPTRGA